MTLNRISPEKAEELCRNGAKLVDIRGSDEHVRAHIPGSRNIPLDQLGPLEGDEPVIFHCRTGMRTGSNAEKLALCCNGNGYLLDGGIDRWKAEGMPVTEDRSQPLPIMRQVQITAGTLILIGVLLAAFVAPGFIWLSGFVGAGLLFAGLSGWCGMATLLSAMPWNRKAAG
ncbi:DUF2892 domain-containing protein [Altererythrobacter endophyticus]|uniref:DUF2892 domain-containing protein n=2 Tax=Altericroceibacterium endophyticum TaxID=1808508 RepID=A0A6I4T6Q3_9SPHN|nr:rhodanese family protein [Altericroceibacterium endophyticum]MXO65485.1 DUF2892 domain-containing protein [Altericroceibacterium endophyticum]